MKEKKTVSCSMENSLSMNTGRIIKGTRRKNKECEVNQTGPEGLNRGKIKNSTEDVIHRCLNSEGRRDHRNIQDFKFLYQAHISQETFEKDIQHILNTFTV